MSTRANLIKCRGLHTHGNELTRPEGSLRKADNVNIDEDGVITPRRGFSDYGNFTGNIEDPNNKIKQMMQYKDRIIRHYQNLLEYEDADGIFQAVTGSYQELDEGLRLKFQEANSNLYFTTSDGIKKISVKKQEDLNSEMVTNAGGLKAGYAFGTVVPALGGFLPPQSKVSYRILVGNKDENGNLIIGTPSARFVVTNFSESIGSSELSTIQLIDSTLAQWVSGTPSTVGEEIQNNGNAYRLIDDNTQEPTGTTTDANWEYLGPVLEYHFTDKYVIYTNSTAKYVIYFNNDSEAEAPETGDTVGGTYIRSKIGDTLSNTSSNLANAIANQIAEIEVNLDTAESKVTLTSNEEGDIPGLGANSGTEYFSTSTEDGSVTEGDFANVKITGVVPNGVDENNPQHFYQVYRTGFIEATDGLTLNDIDPGDEGSLVYEAPFTSEDVAKGEFVFVDNNPDSLRLSNLALYTNEVTGEGILQANEAPPIAKDVELFRNSMFYANTKSRHQLQFDLLSVDDFVSDSTRIIVGNDQITRYYTLVGTNEVTELTTADSFVTVNGATILLSNANDERDNYIWFDKTRFFDNTNTFPNGGFPVDSITGTDPIDTVFTLIGNTFLNNERIIYDGNEYYVINSVGNNLSLSNTIGGDAVEFPEDINPGPEVVISYANANVEIPGAKGYRIILENSDNADDIADKIRAALAENTDFDLTIPLDSNGNETEPKNPVKFIYKNNGYTKGMRLVDQWVSSEEYEIDDVVQNSTNIYKSLVSNPQSEPTGVVDTADWEYVSTEDSYEDDFLGLNWNITRTLGTGELSKTDQGGDILLSGLSSTAQAIDETARSLVKIISQDNSSPINAYYLSTTEDLPGKILLENRSLEDRTFYIAVEEDSFQEIGQEFNPELPQSKQFENIEIKSETTIITQSDHGYTNGQQLFISYLDNTNTPSVDYSFSGIFNINLFTTAWSNTEDYEIGDIVVEATNVYRSLVISPATQPSGVVDTADWEYLGEEASLFYLERAGGDDFTDASPEFSSTFTADVESDNQESENRLFFSKLREPEAVPSVNFIDVGPKDEQIQRILALRDNLFVLKDDGIYIVSGTSAPNFSVRLLDNTRIISADSAVVLNNQIYCLTEQGITVVTDSGAGIVSRPIENLIDSFTNQSFDFEENTFGISYENDRAYILFCPEKDTDTSATQAFRYNIFEKTWSRWEYDATCGLVLERDKVLYLGNGDTNITSRERKDNIREDHSDKNFSTFINDRGTDGTILEVSSLSNIKVNDVVVQNQDLTINYLNRRVLSKLDSFDNTMDLGVAGSVNYNETTGILNFSVPYPHNLANNSDWDLSVVDDDGIEYRSTKKVTVINDFLFTVDYGIVDYDISSIKFLDYYYKTFFAKIGDTLSDKISLLNQHLVSLESYLVSTLDVVFTTKTITESNLKEQMELLIDELNDENSLSLVKNYKKPETTVFEAYITKVDRLRNQITVHTERPWIQGSIDIYKNIKKEVEWNPQHFGDPSALKQVRFVTIIFDQNNFNIATAKFTSDVSQGTDEVPFNGKGVAYWGDLAWNNANAYFGGTGNDVPFRTPVPRGKQKCRYLSVTFDHRNAREYFRILGVTAEVRAISGRAYR